MNILAVDATSDALSAALAADGGIWSARRRPRAHDEALLGVVEGLLRRAKLEWNDLDAIAAAAGPGRFTGIRVGLAFAAAAGWKLGVPALALSRLEAAAVAAGRPRALAAVAGWKGEVYHQEFLVGRGVPRAQGGPQWSTAEAWPAARAAAEGRGLVVDLGEPDARALLEPARRRLAAGKIPPLKPLYLKPAGYERSRR